jgi:hypothetical protein
MAANSYPFHPRHATREGGVALVMTLMTLCILALLLIAFFSTMSIEHKAAHAVQDTQGAKLIAQGAVAHAIDLLRTNIPDPARLAQGAQRLSAGANNMVAVNWIVNPGRLTIIPASGTPQYIDLHTGAVTSPPDPAGPPDADSVDLNQPLPGPTTPGNADPGQTVPVITGGNTAAPMRVRWINLLSDPSSPPGPTNQLTGRYAFWIDDECARINFNTAVGKPVPGSGTMFGDQLGNGFVTPLYTMGDNLIAPGSNGPRQWALGRPSSVDLDVLFPSPSQLNTNQLIDQVFLHGFSRYPEAIMNYVNIPGQTPQSWFDRQKFNLTFYSRSPEFNAFGLSRFFTTYVPLSLEGGPAYQHPFLYNGILHLNSLFGTFGFTSTVTDNEDSGSVDGGNVVNQEQVNMLLSYLERPWPGYSQSFFDKYGPQGCAQIALNLLLMARMATASVSTDLTNFSIDWGFRSTSVNYCPSTSENANDTPARMYWSINPTTGTPIVPSNLKVTPPPTLMLPQTPGPHITEVRLIVQAVPASPAPKNLPAQLKNYVAPRYIQYQYEVKYYMHPGGPVVDISQFPARMAYLDIAVNGGGQSNPTLQVNQQFGPTNGADTTHTTNWNTATNLGQLQVLPTAGTALGPAGSTYPNFTVGNDISVRSAWATIGQNATVVPSYTATDYSTWLPLVFDAAKSSTATVNIRFRPGMGVANAPARPRQMIPLGLTQTDTLQASFTVNLLQSGQQVAMSWQIQDPRLSWDLTQWQKIGPGSASTTGSPNQPNINEPSETSTQKSKFRYFERAPTGATIMNYALDRPNEIDTASRVSSPGYWSLIHTGMQSHTPWQTLNLGPTASQAAPPDYLLLDLIAATYPMIGDQFALNNNVLPDSYSSISYMNSTAGQINLNSRIYPQNTWFQPPARTLPLQAVFKNLLSDSDGQNFVNSIVAYQTNQQFFSYVGELANVPGFTSNGTTQWQQESLLRNMAGCLTTKSNTFGVWGVAQVVKKRSTNTQYNAFENGDSVTAEKRFYALVERYVWPGRDGVPGNGHVTNGGIWDRLATQSAPISSGAGITNTLFQLPGSPPLVRNGTAESLNLDTSGSYPIFDGPEAVTMDTYSQAALGSVRYLPSSLANAYNPPQPVVKYRVVYFKYLDE